MIKIIQSKDIPFLIFKDYIILIFSQFNAHLPTGRGFAMLGNDMGGLGLKSNLRDGY